MDGFVATTTSSVVARRCYPQRAAAAAAAAAAAVGTSGGAGRALEGEGGGGGVTSVGTLRLQVWPEFGHVLRVGRLGRDGLVRHVRVPGFDAAGHHDGRHARRCFDWKDV
jgi:hypothetical protein